MTSVLVLNASPRAKDAHAFQLALRAAGNLGYGGEPVDLTVRHLADQPAGPVSAGYADAITNRHPHDAPALQASERLIAEVEQADYLVIATPMHNYTVPATLKTWIDNVLRSGRTFAHRDGRKAGLLVDRPTLVIVSTGGPLQGALAQPDHLTGLMTDVLATMGITTVRFVYLEQVIRPELADAVLAGGRQAIDGDPTFGAAWRAVSPPVPAPSRHYA